MSEEYLNGSQKAGQCPRQKDAHNQQDEGGEADGHEVHGRGDQGAVQEEQVLSLPGTVLNVTEVYISQ